MAGVKKMLQAEFSSKFIRADASVKLGLFSNGKVVGVHKGVIDASKRLAKGGLIIRVSLEYFHPRY